MKPRPFDISIVEIVWSAGLLSLFALILWLGFGVSGLRLFGARSQLLSRGSAVLIGLLVVTRLRGIFAQQRLPYIKADLIILFLPFIFLPFTGKMAGGGILAQVRGYDPLAVARQLGTGQYKPVANPFTGKAASSSVLSKGPQDSNRSPVVMQPQSTVEATASTTPLPASQTSSSAGKISNADFSGTSLQTPPSSTSLNTISTAVSQPQSSDGGISNIPDYILSSSSSGTNLAEEDPIILDTKYFQGDFEEITKNPQNYAGREVIIEGFTISADYFQLKGFVLGRLLVWCCPGDAVMLGFLLDLPVGTLPPEPGSWWHMEGKLKVKKLPATKNENGKILEATQVPVIAVEKSKSIKMPDDPYIYPH